MDIRTHKTSTKNRGHYTYFLDNGRKITLEPGKDGVTSEIIRQLHSLDDNEVESNLRYYEVKLPKIKGCKKAEKIWISSFEQTFEYINDDKNNLMFDAAIYNQADTADMLIKDLSLKEIVETKLTVHQKKVVTLICSGYKSTEIAKILDISDAAITKTKKRIAEALKEYKTCL